MKLVLGLMGVGARDIVLKKSGNGFENLFKEVPKLPVFLKNGSGKENLIRSMLFHRINEEIGLVGYDVDYDQVFIGHRITADANPKDGACELTQTFR